MAAGFVYSRAPVGLGIAAREYKLRGRESGPASCERDTFRTGGGAAGFVDGDGPRAVFVCRVVSVLSVPEPRTSGLSRRADDTRDAFQYRHRGDHDP